MGFFTLFNIIFFIFSGFYLLSFFFLQHLFESFFLFLSLLPLLLLLLLSKLFHFFFILFLFLSFLLFLLSSHLLDSFHVLFLFQFFCLFFNFFLFLLNCFHLFSKKAIAIGLLLILPMTNHIGHNFFHVKFRMRLLFIIYDNYVFLR